MSSQAAAPRRLLRLWRPHLLSTIAKRLMSSAESGLSPLPLAATAALASVASGSWRCPRPPLRCERARHCAVAAATARRAAAAAAAMVRVREATRVAVGLPSLCSAKLVLMFRLQWARSSAEA